MGWLEKQPLENYYINWIGDIYTGNPFERKWRDYFFWDKYTNEQIESLGFLCQEIIKELKINNEIIGHNTKVNGIQKFEGIVSKSNFDSNSTDVNPSFDFEMFKNTIQL